MGTYRRLGPGEQTAPARGGRRCTMEKAASRGEELPMATDDPIRASDADREVVVATLREAYTAGRLTLDEFDERMAGAYASKTWGDLRHPPTALPSQPVRGSDVPGRQLPAAAGLPQHPPRSALK